MVHKDFPEVKYKILYHCSRSDLVNVLFIIVRVYTPLSRAKIRNGTHSNFNLCEKSTQPLALILLREGWAIPKKEAICPKFTRLKISGYSFINFS